jgi:hypothetical protein
MASTADLTTGIDDDGEALVQQVLAENPVQERGERQEWKHQVGWHRKEDIIGGLRGAGKPTAGTTIPPTTQQIEPVSFQPPGPKPAAGSKKRDQSLLAASAIPVAGVLFLLILCCIILIRRKSNANIREKNNRSK